MKINIGTTKGNLVAFQIDKNWKEIKLNDLIPIVQQKLGNEASIIGWAPYYPQHNPEEYKQKEFYKNMSNEDKVSFDSYFSRAIAAGMELEVLDFVEEGFNFGETPLQALVYALREWDC